MSKSLLEKEQGVVTCAKTTSQQGQATLLGVQGEGQAGPKQAYNNESYIKTRKADLP